MSKNADGAGRQATRHGLLGTTYACTRWLHLLIFLDRMHTLVIDIHIHAPSKWEWKTNTFSISHRATDDGGPHRRGLSGAHRHARSVSHTRSITLSRASWSWVSEWVSERAHRVCLTSNQPGGRSAAEEVRASLSICPFTIRELTSTYSEMRLNTQLSWKVTKGILFDDTVECKADGFWMASLLFVTRFERNSWKNYRG